MHETLVTVTGNLLADPELRTTSRGDVFATFRLACTERRRDKEGLWGDGHTNIVRVTVWRQLASNVVGTLRRGNRAIVQGRLRVTDWESGDRRGTSVEVDAHCVGAELSFAHAEITRGTWSSVKDPMDDAAVRAAHLEQDAGVPRTEGYGGPLVLEPPLAEVEEDAAQAYDEEGYDAEAVDPETGEIREELPAYA